MKAITKKAKNRYVLSGTIKDKGNTEKEDPKDINEIYDKSLTPIKKENSSIEMMLLKAKNLRNNSRKAISLSITEALDITEKERNNLQMEKLANENEVNNKEKKLTEDYSKLIRKFQSHENLLNEILQELKEIKRNEINSNIKRVEYVEKVFSIISQNKNNKEERILNLPYYLKDLVNQ
jgi:hypothetical protein